MLSIRPQQALDAIPPRPRQAGLYNPEMRTLDYLTYTGPSHVYLLAATTAMLHYCLCGPKFRLSVTPVIPQASDSRHVDGSSLGSSSIAAGKRVAGTCSNCLLVLTALTALSEIVPQQY